MFFLKWGVKNYYMKVALSMFYGMIAVYHGLFYS